MSAIARLLLRIDTDTSGAVKDLDNTASRFDKFKGIAATAFAVAGPVALVAGLTKSVEAASDLNETISKSATIFGDAAGGVERFASQGAAVLGQTKQQALDAAATFGTMGKVAGLTGEDLGKFSTDLVGLTTDMASFANTTPEEAIQAVGSALRGEAEPIRKYGVLLDDATLRQKALEMGLIKTTKEALTPANKVLAANAAIMEQTTDAQGDFAKTSGGLAGQTKIAQAALGDLATTVGSALLPIIVSVANFLTGSVFPVLGQLGAIAGDAVKLFFGAFTGEGADIESDLGGVTNVIINLGSTAREVFDRLVSVFNEVKGGVVAFFAAFQAGDGEVTSSGFPGFMERLGGIARQVFDFLSEKVPPILETLKAGFEKVSSVVTDTLLPALTGFGSWLVDHKEILASVGIAIGILATIILVAMVPSLIAWAAASGAAAVANALLWAPLVLVIGILAALVFAVIYAYQNLQIFRDAVDLVAQGFLWFWNSVLSPFIGFLFGKVVPGIVEVVKAIAGAFAWVIGKIAEFIASAIDTVNSWWNSVKNAAESVKGAFGGVADFVVGVVNRVKDFLNGMIDFVMGLPGRISDIASGMWDSITSGFKSAINWIIDGWNNLAFRIPGFDVGPVHFDGFALDTPNIPRLASGGIVTRPTLALIGEAGPEAVMPLGRRSSGSVINITVNHTGLGVDSPRLQRDLVAALRSYERRNGAWR